MVQTGRHEEAGTAPAPGGRVSEAGFRAATPPSPCPCCPSLHSSSPQSLRAQDSCPVLHTLPEIPDTLPDTQPDIL